MKTSLPLEGKMKSVLKIAVFFTIVLVTSQSKIYAQSGVSLDRVAQLRDGAVAVDVPASFFIRFNNDYPGDVHGFSLAFRFYLSNNGELANGAFTPMTHNIINTQDWTSFFTLLPVVTQNYSTNGFASDTVGIRGVESFLLSSPSGFSSLAGGGLPIGFNDVVLNLETTPLSAHIGDSLCIDSSYYAPANAWHWHLEGNIRFEDLPWSGPHCFEIVEKCCVGIRGNVDLSSGEEVDISDLVMLVDFIFTGGFEPYCPTESDLTVDGEVDISDLVELVSFIFTNGPPPLPYPK